MPNTVVTITVYSVKIITLLNHQRCVHALLKVIHCHHLLESLAHLFDIGFVSLVFRSTLFKAIFYHSTIYHVFSYCYIEGFYWSPPSSSSLILYVVTLNCFPNNLKWHFLIFLFLKGSFLGHQFL